eukprot:4135756-Amphidinium_carterae.2
MSQFLRKTKYVLLRILMTYTCPKLRVATPQVDKYVHLRAWIACKLARHQGTKATHVVASFPNSQYHTP